MNNKLIIWFITLLIIIIFTLSLLHVIEIEVPPRLMNSILIGISIYTYINAMKTLIDNGEINWRITNFIMKWPKIITVIIGPSLVLSFYLIYPSLERFTGSQITNSSALIAFCIVLTGYLGETKNETPNKEIKEIKNEKNKEVNKKISVLIYTFIGMISMFFSLIRFLFNIIMVLPKLIISKLIIKLKIIERLFNMIS